MTDGITTWNYTYDANGMRTSRSNGSKTYNYVYNGSQLTQMTVGNDTLYFTYGVLGPSTVTWNGTTYYYALNGQGDVTGIYDADGNLVVFYYWENAWGYNPFVDGPLASTLGALNPLRYRSYVYDTETGYYYLQSRYYDPEIGRFINADGLVATGQGMLGNNMFAYCNNNPVIYEDASGHALKPCIVAINDGNSGKPKVEVIIAEDESSISYSGCEKLAKAYMKMAKPNAIGTITATIKRDGSHTVHETEYLEKCSAFIGMVGFWVPGIYDESILGITIGSIMALNSLLLDGMTLLSIDIPATNYDRYSITETWTALERCGDHPNAFRKVNYSRTSYYYYAPADNTWISCGMVESWDVEDDWIH